MAQDDGRLGVVRSMQHYLDNRLESFSNSPAYPPSSPANKTNGYAAAKVPEWQLRQWVSCLTGGRTDGKPSGDEPDDYHTPDVSGYSRADEEWFFDVDGRP